MINDHKVTTKLQSSKTKSGEWEIQWSMHVNFISSKDPGENVWSDNAEIMMGNKTNDIIKELFRSFLDNYQKEGQIMREGSDFIFKSVELLDYHVHKIRFKRGKSYIKSPKWLENKRATTNPQNKKDSCFQYAITVALNHNKFEKRDLHKKY